MRTTHARRSTSRLISRSALTTALVSAAVAAVTAGGLAGCAAAQPAGGAQPSGTGETVDSALDPSQDPASDPTGGSAAACVDWVSFETPAEAAADAGAVLRGTVVEQDGTAQMYGVESNRWLVSVEEVLERPDPPSGRPQTQPELEVSPGEQITVVSTPQTCSGEAYLEGDPLDPASGLGGADGSVIILLSAALGDGFGDGSAEQDDVDDFHLITPYQGVLTPAKDGALPSKWPAS
ncbi:hypothetical protein [Promicromonospora sp. NPDC050249]|uniref:hypothetical protein n=1 Tax=Promicromonospora sp. NPDC050249 TaxID=3154743 RepID=UPI0033FAC985